MTLGISPSEIVGKGTYQLLCRASHWGRIPLSQVAEVHNGFAFKSACFDRENGVPLIRIRDIQGFHTEHRYFGEFDERYKVRPGDILVGMDGDFTVARWRGEEGLLNQCVCRIQIQSSLFDGKFLFLCLQPYLNAINAETSSVTVKHLSSKTIEAIPLPLPPLNEQHRIVAKIEGLFSELDKGVENLEKAREQLKVYRQAVLKHAFEGKLTARWREENKDELENPEQLLGRIKQERSTRYDQQLQEWNAAVQKWEDCGRFGKKPARLPKLRELSELSPTEVDSLPFLPSCWSHLRLGWLIDEPKYGTARKCVYNYEGTGVLRIPNVVLGTVDASDLKGAHFEEDEKRAYALRKGDILVIRSNGSRSIVGRCALISKAEEQYLYAGYLIRLRSNPAALLPEFLSALLSSHLLRTQIEHKAKSTSGVNNINSKEIQSFIVPLCSLGEQEEVINQLSASLSAIDSAQVEIRNQLFKVTALRQSILKKAFSGQLVAQDPNDEPASVLLERIKAQKIAQSQTAKLCKQRRRAKATA